MQDETLDTKKEPVRPALRSKLVYFSHPTEPRTNGKCGDFFEEGSALC